MENGAQQEEEYAQEPRLELQNHNNLLEDTNDHIQKELAEMQRQLDEEQLSQGEEIEGLLTSEDEEDAQPYVNAVSKEQADLQKSMGTDRNFYRDTNLFSYTHSN